MPLYSLACASSRLGQFKVEVLPFCPSIGEQEKDQDWLNRRLEVFCIVFTERKNPFWEPIYTVEKKTVHFEFRSKLLLP